MTILLLLIPISLALLGVAVWAFVWAVRRGQFDDLDSAALDILADDRAPTPISTPRAPTPSPSVPPPAVSTSDNHAD